MALEVSLCRQVSHSQASCSRSYRQSLQPTRAGPWAEQARTRGFEQTAPLGRWQPLRALTPSSETAATVTGLQDELNAAVSAEDYQRAAQLRDQLQKLQQDSTAAVAEANRKFYAAFEHCSIQAMKEIWGDGEHVQCLHPAANCIQGRQDVLESWRLVLRGEFQIRLENVRIHAWQDTGYVTCVEVMNAGNATGRTMATNIFEKQNGTWKLILHHGGPLPTGM